MIKMNGSPLVMGILNINSDSFYSNSRINSVSHFQTKFNQMIEDGADIIDIGACSTRPGSQYITENEEWDRLLPMLKSIKGICPDITISIDTFRSEIVKKTFDLIGPFIVNDISCSIDDHKMFETVGRLGLEYIGMHKRGTPNSMQLNCDYNDIINDIREFFIDSIEKAKQSGITKFIIDPGFGFSKNIDQNYKLINNLESIKIQVEEQRYYPILIGISRKSMLYKPLNSTPADVLHATSALNLLALTKGADIIRVHDVKEAKEIVKIYDKLKNNI